MALLLISQESHTLQHFGCCTGRALHGTSHQKGPQHSIFITDPSGGAACPSFISTNKGQPCPGPQHQQRCRGILQWKNSAPLATPKPSPQWGSAAPPSPSSTDRARAGAPAHQEQVCSWVPVRKRRNVHLPSRSLFNFSSLNSFNCIS